MFESLTQRLEAAFKRLRGQGRLTEANMKEALQEIRQALLEADVHYKVVKKFIADVQEAALGREVLDSIHPSQMVVKIVHDELVRLMGERNEPLRLADKGVSVIMMVGLQGQGKTTTAGKLSGLLKRRGRNPMLVAADVYRPAAVEQLETVARQVGVDCFAAPVGTDPVAICQMARAEAPMRGADTLILDTAGRLHVDEEMMNEVRRIAEILQPHEILFVASAMTGQDAVRSAKQFHDTLPLTGVVLTQMDGDARGGAAISLIDVTGCPIKFIGTGEKLDAIEPFHPDRMATQILGMGDVVSLVERAQEVVDRKQAEDFQRKARKGDWNLEDFLAQMQQVKRLGAFGDLIRKIPGIAKVMPEGLDDAEQELKRTEAIILSMTPKERRNPAIINGSRRRRIADGSGTSVQEVNMLLKEFERMKKMVKQAMKGGSKRRGMRGVPPGGPFPF